MGNSMFRTDNKFVLSIIKPLARYFLYRSEYTSGNETSAPSGPLTATDVFRYYDSDGVLYEIPYSDLASALFAETGTLTSKRITKRVDSQVSTATITPEISTFDMYIRTAQAVNITINVPATSTPLNGDMQLFVLTDDGVAAAKTITYGGAGAVYVAKSGIALPTTLVSAKCTKLLFMYRTSILAWDLLGTTQEA